MDVTKDMILWLHPLLHCAQQLDTASTHTGATEITMTHGRSVGDQDIHTWRYLIPFIKARGATRHIEGPATEFWLPRGTIDTHAPQLQQLILQVDAVGQSIPYVGRLHSALHALLVVAQCGQIIQNGHASVLSAVQRAKELESGKDYDSLHLPFGMSRLALLILQWMREGAIEAELMIACNHDLMLVRQCTNPIVELHHLLQLTALGKVAGMNEYIAIGYIELDVWRQ